MEELKPKDTGDEPKITKPLNAEQIVATIQVDSSDETFFECANNSDIEGAVSADKTSIVGDTADANISKKTEKELTIEEAVKDKSDAETIKSGATAADDAPKVNIIFTNRQEFKKMIMRLCQEGDGDAKKIVMELLNISKSNETYSVIERVSENMIYLLRAKTLVDAGINLGNERYFRFKEVMQNYVKLHAARIFIDKLTHHTPELVLEEGELTKLVNMVAEDVLQIPELMRQLSGSLEKMDFFNEDAAFKVYLEVRPYHQAEVLRELMLTRISRVFLCVVSSTSFLNFDEHELLHIINNCYISVNSEIEIFLAVIRWLEHNWLERQNCAERVLGVVRYGLIPAWYFTTLEKHNKNDHFLRIIKMNSVQALLTKGLEQCLELRGRIANKSATQDPINKPLPRDWIADPDCFYHHRCQCAKFVYPTYDVFQAYLAKIICFAPNYWEHFKPSKQVFGKVLKCCTKKPFYVNQF